MSTDDYTELRALVLRLAEERHDPTMILDVVAQTLKPDVPLWGGVWWNPIMRATSMHVDAEAMNHIDPRYGMNDRGLYALSNIIRNMSRFYSRQETLEMIGSMYGPDRKTA
jgi:hypothetical protein